MRIAKDLLGLVGDTPMVELTRMAPKGGARVLAKLEFFNPGGSVKDRIGLSLVEAGERSGRLKPGGTIVEPTSGNTGVGLALAAAVKGYKLVCVLPDKVPTEKIRLLEAYGARCVICPTAVAPDDPRAYYNVAKRIEKEEGAYRPNQYENPANPEAHYRSTGPEIWRDTKGRLSAFVAGMGTGGTITGTGRFLKEKDPSIQVVGVDPKGSILKEAFEHEGQFKTKPKTYLIDGIGEDFVPGATDFSVIDEILQCTDEDAYSTTMALARKEGLLVGSSSGAAVWGALEYAKRLQPKETLVVLLPDSGERYLSKLNPTWLKEKGLTMAAAGGR